MFRRVDQEPTIRQVYPIAQLGKPASEPTRAPAFMQLLVAPGHPVIPGDHLDYRDEIMAQIFDRGDPVPKRTLTFTINVTDEGKTHGTPFRVRRTFGNWRQIGQLVFDNAVASLPTATPSFTSLIRPGGGIATILQPPRGATGLRLADF